MSTRWKAAWTAVFLVLAATGLSCSNSDQPDVGLVSGTVTLDGQPYPDAQVIFTPENGRPSTGITDSGGKYELSYTGDTKGAALGTHTVRITTVQRSTSDRGEDPPFVERIPAKYHVATTLKEEVKPGQNTIDFPLTSS